MKTVLVCGAGGFIGSHLVDSLKEQGHYVIGADLRYPRYTATSADQFHIMDLRDQNNVNNLITSDIDEIYQLAADMGGAGYIFTGDHDADIMHNSAIINLNVLDAMRKSPVNKIFYSSSACMYPAYNQLSTTDPNLKEDSAYPADPDSEYGWEKLFSERLYMAYAKNYGINVRIARFHNIYGPNGSWNNGKEKSPAAICRKVIMSTGEIDIWGTGEQTRSFLYIDECIKGMHHIMAGEYDKPLNLGSEYMISINNLVSVIANIAGKQVTIRHIKGPTGVTGRKSDNTLIREKLGWAPDENLSRGLLMTYNWIEEQIKAGIEDSI